jgi:RNA polymerase sigma factor (sigma-70 family)
MKKENEKSVSAKVLAKIRRLSLTAAEKDRLEELMAAPIAYIPDSRFTKPTQMKPVMEQNIKVLPSTLLGAEDEQTLFLQMNYARHKLCQRRRRLLRQAHWRKKDVEPLLEWDRLQIECRSKIVTSNMGLVLSMVQRVSYPGVEFSDLISEGSMALLRAVEKFDCARGFKFSTYACRAILKGFSRAAKQNYRYRNLFPTQLDTTLEKDNKVEREREEVHEELVDEVRTIVGNNLADLSDIEQKVVKMRFSLADNQPAPLTLKQVGERLCLTKERIRQIQNKALSKLRIVAEDRLVTV